MIHAVNDNGGCIIGDKTIPLNQEQYNVVMLDSDINIVCQACAGSGKTTTMTTRIAHMIYNLKLSAKEFLVVTFTRNAAKEMTKRIKNLIGEQADSIACGTFHSIAWNTMHSVMNTDNVSSEYHVEYHVDEYQLLFYQHLQNNSSPYRYIFVDEYQDINDLQHSIIQELYKHATQLMVVGDEAQNIYSFRNSSIKYIRKFETYFTDRPVVRTALMTNYRSSVSIINVANDVLKTMNTSIPLMKASKAPDDLFTKGPIITVKHCDTFNQEIEYVVNSIKELLSKDTLSDDSNEKQNKTIVILSRINMSLYKIEESLICEKISYQFISKNHQCNENTTVSLSTIHSSKGLEWDHVFIIGMSDVHFPSCKQSIEEERRLFYVAVTRARKQCFISYSMNPKMLTRFITQLNADLLDMKSTSCGLRKYKESNYERKKYVTIQGLIGLMDGVEFNNLRHQCHLNDLALHKQTIHPPYSIPEFVINEDIEMEYIMYLEQVVRRSIEQTFNIYHDNPKINDTMMDLLIVDEFNLSQMRDNPLVFRKIILNSEHSTIPIPKGMDVMSYYDRPTLQFSILKDVTRSYQKYLNHQNQTTDILFDIYTISRLCVLKKRKGVFYKNVTNDDILGTKKHASNIGAFISNIHENIIWDSDLVFHNGIKIIISPVFSETATPRWNCSISVNQTQYRRHYSINDNDVVKTDDVRHINDVTRLDVEMVVNDVMYIFLHSEEVTLPLEIFLETLVAVTMLQKCDIPINTIVFYNSITGLVHHCNVANWMFCNDFLDTLFASALLMKNNI